MSIEKENNPLRDSKTIRELISKIIGPITPTGSDYEDHNRLENLKVYGELIDSMILDINKISIHYKNHYEESIKEIVKEADMILKEIRE